MKLEAIVKLVTITLATEVGLGQNSQQTNGEAGSYNLSHRSGIGAGESALSALTNLDSP